MIGGGNDKKMDTGFRRYGLKEDYRLRERDKEKETAPSFGRKLPRRKR